MKKMDIVPYVTSFPGLPLEFILWSGNETTCTVVATLCNVSLCLYIVTVCVYSDTHRVILSTGIRDYVWKSLTAIVAIAAAIFVSVSRQDFTSLKPRLSTVDFVPNLQDKSGILDLLLQCRIRLVVDCCLATQPWLVTVLCNIPLAGYILATTPWSKFCTEL